MREAGCTGFTNTRFAVPELCREMGYEFGIYLDCDMIVLGDITELFQYARAGQWSVLEDGSNEVSVICASLKYPPKETLHMRHKGTLPRGYDRPVIPLCWNVEDRVEPKMKLLHFTGLDTQPWFYDHPDEQAVEIYREYYGRHHHGQGQV